MYSCCSTRVFSYLVCAWQQAHVSKQIYVTVNINNVKNTFTKNKKKIFFSVVLFAEEEDCLSMAPAASYLLSQHLEISALVFTLYKKSKDS